MDQLRGVDLLGIRIKGLRLFEHPSRGEFICMRKESFSGWDRPRLRRQLRLNRAVTVARLGAKGHRFSWVLGVAWLAVWLLPVGCQPAGEVLLETDLAAYQRGQRLLREQRPQEALIAFQSVVSERPENSPESHLELGRLYLEHFSDPVAAAYHFRRSLEHFEGSPRGPLIQGLIATAHRDFARQLPANPLQAEVARLDLLVLLEKERATVLSQREALALAEQRAKRAEEAKAALETRLAEAERTAAGARQQAEDASRRTGLATGSPPLNSAAASPAASASSAATPATPAGSSATRVATTLGSPEAGNPGGPAVRTHVVRSGDTLSSIAREVYGNASRWREIFDANRDTLPTEHSLRVGQTLKIP